MLRLRSFTHAQYPILLLVFGLLFVSALTSCSSKDSDSTSVAASLSPLANQTSVPTTKSTVQATSESQPPTEIPSSTVASPVRKPDSTPESRKVWGETSEFYEVPCVTLKEPTQRSIGTAPPVDRPAEDSSSFHDEDYDLTYALSEQLIQRSLNWIAETQIGWESDDLSGRLSKLQEISTRLSTYCLSYRLIPTSEELDSGFLEEMAKLLQDASVRVTKIAGSESLLSDSLEEEISDLQHRFDSLLTQLGENVADEEYFVYDTTIGIRLEAPIDWLPVRDDSIFSISFGFELQEPVGTTAELSGWRIGNGLRISKFAIPTSTPQDRLDLIRTSLAQRWGSQQSEVDVILGSNDFHVIQSESESGWKTLSSTSLISGDLWIFEFACGKNHVEDCESIMHRTLESVSFGDSS